MASPKILKNTTGSDIFISALGLNILAFGQVTVDTTDYLRLASDDSITELTPLINSGDVVVNDGISDLSAAVGIAYIGYTHDAAAIRFVPEAPLVSTDANSGINEAAQNADVALNTPRYTIVLQHNGNVSNNTFIGYDSLIPGDDTPIVVPVKSELVEYTFSNSRSNADYAIELRKNSTGATPFNTVSVDNTQTFVEDDINEPFNPGDEVYVKYIDEGTNASDAVILLLFKAVP